MGNSIIHIQIIRFSYKLYFPKQANKIVLSVGMLVFDSSLPSSTTFLTTPLRPEEVVIPEYMWQLTPTWMLYCSPSFGGNVKVNGRTLQKVLSGVEVKALKVSSGAQCGLHTVCPCVCTWGYLIGQYYYKTELE